MKAILAALGISVALVAGGLGTLVYAQTDVSGVIDQVNTTLGIVSALVGSGVGIAAAIVNWLRSKTGDKVISDGTNEWLQWLFEQTKEAQLKMHDVSAQLASHKAEFNVLVDVIKNAHPDVKKAIEDAQPQLESKLGDINDGLARAQEQVNRLFEITPKADPVTTH